MVTPERAEQVDVVNPRENLDRHVLVGRHVEDGRVVDEDIELPVAAPDRLGERGDRGILGDVDARKGRTLDRGRNLPALRLVDLRDPNARSFGGQAAGDCFADTPPAPVTSAILSFRR